MWQITIRKPVKSEDLSAKHATTISRRLTKGLTTLLELTNISPTISKGLQMKHKTTKLYLSPQNIVVLKHLRDIGPMTQLNAQVNFGIANLPARINELRTMGEPIKTQVKVENFHKYASYSL